MPTTTLPAPSATTTRTPAQSAAEAPAKPSRDPFFDNAKFLLVALVVVGHSWTLVPSDSTVSWVYRFLYAWHVPAFVLVTGYLSRSMTWSPKRLRSLFTTVVVPYVLFEGLLALFRTQVGGEDLEKLWINPHWPMWYLAALFFWRLATPVFTRMPAAAALGTALVISLVGGIIAPSDTLDISRTLGLLPFFVLGLTLRREHLALLRHRVARAAGGIFLVVLLLAVPLTSAVPTEWLYYRTPYAELGVSPAVGVGVRALLLVVGLLGAASFLALVPTRRTWFSVLGAASLVVYLFHGFAVKSVALTGFPGWAGDHVPAALLLTSLTSFGVAVLLSQPKVAARLNHVVDPVGSLDRLDHATPSSELERLRRHSVVPRTGIGR
ncbi:membrane protein [Marmoricola endophyticus]|uniref:Membrane protein n=1 Tax=Marmoricola endophyticus TaxID=2040280 RepID=A0A917BH81_9ACTN|nr:acyltransferase family protein [Marmoricola endophyticus]GGF43212.1 membrane protein [Marmoricola endophyticus]